MQSLTFQRTRLASSASITLHFVTSSLIKIDGGKPDLSLLNAPSDRAFRTPPIQQLISLRQSPHLGCRITLGTFLVRRCLVIRGGILNATLVTSFTSAQKAIFTKYLRDLMRGLFPF